MLHTVFRIQQGRQKESDVYTVAFPHSSQILKYCVLNGGTQRPACSRYQNKEIKIIHAAVTTVAFSRCDTTVSIPLIFILNKNHKLKQDFIKIYRSQTILYNKSICFNKKVAEPSRFGGCRSVTSPKVTETTSQGAPENECCYVKLNIVC